MQIALPPELEKRIPDSVASGECSNGEEVMRVGPRRLFAEGQSDAFRQQELWAKIQVGLNTAESEEGRNGDAFLAELDDYVEELTFSTLPIPDQPPLVRLQGAGKRL